MKKALLTLALLGAINACSSLSPQSALPGPNRIDAEVRRMMHDTGARGLALAVIDKGQVTQVLVYGDRNEAGAPLQQDSILYAASLTKMTFGYLVMQLVEDGILDLDRSIAEYLPRPLTDYGSDEIEDRYARWSDLAGDERWRDLTPRLLLNHSSGFANFGFLEPDGRLRMHFDPGSMYSYSGDGIILLQFVLEEGLGLDVGKEMQTRVFDPLGMKDTSLMWREDFAGRVADGWTLDGEPVPHDERSRVRAAGSMDTTIGDMATLSAAIVRGDLLSREGRREMMRPQLPITTASQFPTLQQPLPPSQQRPDLAAGLGVVVFDGPQGRGFYKSGHDDNTGNMLACLETGERCVLILGNDLRAEAAIPYLTDFILGEANVPWQWNYGSLPLWSPHAAAVDWSAYGRDAQGTRYLPSSAITRENVSSLEPAWTYRTGETDERYATRNETAFETTPIIVGNTLYLSTPLGRVIALDPVSGEELWHFDPGIRRDVPYGDFASRGVSTWLDTAKPEGAECRRLIYVANAQSQLMALDGTHGTVCKSFGQNGMVDLRQGLRLPPFEDQAYSMTSPAVVVNDRLIVGSSIADNSRPQPASGEVRAYDARSGELLWSWDPIPQDPADPAYEEWQGTLAQDTGAANAWTALSANPALDLVFIPTSSPAPDYYGVLRLGDNRYANSIVALRASTGERVWSFQTTHHDLWDYDNAAPPALTTLVRSGEEIPVVLQATKTGMLFVLDQRTGVPVFDVEERPVPASDIPGEVASPTQPFSAQIPPLAPHRFGAEDAWGPSDADISACREAMAPLRNEGIYTPPSLQGTLQTPSNIGGAHWGGLAVDPQRQIAVVPVNNLSAIIQLHPRESFDRAALRERDGRLGNESEITNMVGTPYIMTRRVILGPTGVPCTPPPWGSLVAVDLNRGDILWNVPLGSVSRMVDNSLSDLVEQQSWGSPNLGGPLVTAGGVVFIGAAIDRWLRAYDIETGQELWKGALPESGKATPMSYRLDNGDQYVVIAVGGGDVWGAGDYVVAFRLSEKAGDNH